MATLFGLATLTTLAQVSSETQPKYPLIEQRGELSGWYEALDGFIAAAGAEGKPDMTFKAWEQWRPSARLPFRLPQEATDTGSTSQIPPLGGGGLQPTEATDSLVDRSHPPGAVLDELAMLATAFALEETEAISVTRLPEFVAESAAIIKNVSLITHEGDVLLRDETRSLRMFLAFLSALNFGEREAFRQLAGIELEPLLEILDFSRLLPSAQTRIDEPQSSAVEVSDHTEENRETIVTGSQPEPFVGGLLEAERLLGLWRSSRIRASRLQPGNLAHSEAWRQAGFYLALLLDSDYSSIIFGSGGAGERFFQEAKTDLDEAWTSIGRAVAIDLRREAAPWLARRLGLSKAPAFGLEYKVHPSPSNELKALMSMSVVVDGRSYGIPYQVAARALKSASAAVFGDAPIPVRYVDEPLPDLRIYVPRDNGDAERAIAELKSDLTAAYPSVLQVPSLLLAVHLSADSVHEDICLALDGAFREVAAGVLLARSFSAVLYGQGYPALASRIRQQADSPAHSGE